MTEYDATEMAYKNGYRQAIKDIFADIEKETKNHGICYTQRKIAELKKKYTEQSEEKYYTPEDVRKMTQLEVRKNYQAIINSMKKWH